MPQKWQCETIRLGLIVLESKKKWEKTLKEHYAEAELLKGNVLKF